MKIEIIDIAAPVAGGRNKAVGPAVDIVIFFAVLLGTYIYIVYRFLTKRTFYSKSFNISLVLMSVITAAIILTVQSSVVISLGMVGALSIVRFRTAI